ncbi:MAG: hypothetical protein WD904_10350 [Dehalococcoidia bacterium]
MRTSHLRWIALALAPILALALAACGDDDDGDSATPTPSSSGGSAVAVDHPDLPNNAACLLLTAEEVTDTTGIEFTQGVRHHIDSDTQGCTFEGKAYTLEVTLQQRATAEDARTAVDEAGPGGDTVAIGDGGLLIGETMVISSDFYLVTLLLDAHRRESPAPVDPGAHEELATLALSRLP